MSRISIKRNKKKKYSLNLEYNKFKFNEEIKYSLTKPYESEQINKCMYLYIKKKFKKLIITDATGGGGGDSINFSKKFKFVNSVEINPDNFEILKENISIFNCKNIYVYNEDYTKIYDKLIQDVIFIDPPWGGPGYKKLKEVHLYMGNIKLSKLIKKIILKKLCNYIFLKVPLNAYLKEIDHKDYCIIYNIYGYPSFKLICIKV